MANLCKSTLIGRVYRVHPTKPTAQAGVEFTKVTMIYNWRRRDWVSLRDEDDPVYLDCYFYNRVNRRQADIASKFLKGMPIYVEGRMVPERLLDAVVTTRQLAIQVEDFQPLASTRQPAYQPLVEENS